MSKNGLMTNSEALEDFYDNYRQDYEHRYEELPSRKKLRMMSFYDYYLSNPYHKCEDFDPLQNYLEDCAYDEVVRSYCYENEGGNYNA